MINDKRIVPVYRSDYLSLIGTVFNLVDFAINQGTPNEFFKPLDADNVNGDFTVADREDQGDLPHYYGWIARQPARSVNFRLSVGTTFLFVPAYDFTGFFFNGEPATMDSASFPVKADGITLYLAECNSLGQVMCWPMTPGV